MLNHLLRVQVDSTDEVVREFNNLIDNINQIEGKVEQQGAEIESLKRQIGSRPTKSWIEKLLKPKKKEKKKGNIQMKTVGALVLLVLAIVGFCCVSRSYAQYRPLDINYDIASNPDLLARYLRDVNLNMQSDSYLFNPRAVAPTAALGRIYYDSGTNEWIGYNGAWTAFDVAAGASLNAAYGVGATITANSGTTTIQTTDADANPALTVIHSGADAAGHGLFVNVSGAAAKEAIKITNTGNGYDIEGQGAAWFVTKTGALTAASADFTGAAGITLQNDETITNADGQITFTDSGTAEDFTIDLNEGADVLLIKSSTGIDEIAFGAIDDLSGINTIAFDAAASSISLAGGGGGQDLTITQSGAVDASVVVHSAGTELDAIKIHTDGDGGIDIDADEDFDVTVTSDAAGEDLRLTQSGAFNAGIVLTSDGTAAIAIKLETTAATGDIWIDSGDDLVIDVAGKYDFDLVGEYELDVAAGINITSSEAADGAITIATSDAAGNIIITSTDATADALDINTTAGGIDIDSASTIAIDNAAGNISINSAAGIVDIDAALAITIDNSDAGEDISITSALGSVNIVASESDAASIKIESTAGGIDILASGATGGEDIDIIATGSSVNITSSEAANLAIKILTSNASGNIQIQSADATADAIDINATAGGLDVDIADTITIDAAAGDITIDAAAGSVNIVGDESAANAIHLDANAGVNGGVDIDAAAGGVDIDAVAGAIGIDCSGATFDIHIDSQDGRLDLLAGETGAAAILIDAEHVDGGIDIDAGTTGISLVADSGDIAIQSTGHTSDLVTITNTTGTAAAGIALVATAGGVEIDAAATKILALDGGSVTIDSKTAGAGAIALTSNQGAADTITITNTQGNTATAISIQATAGGVDIDGMNDDDITLNAGQILITSEESVASAISLITNTGVLETIIVTNTAGTDDAAIDIEATLGGIDIDSTKVINIQGDLAAVSAIIVNASAGGFDIDGNAAISRITNTSTGDGEDLIIEAVGAHESGILIQSAADTNPDSIKLLENGAATSGGILIQAATGVAYADGVASIQLLSTSGGVGISAGVAQANAINFDAAAGGFDVTAALAIDLESSWANAAAIVINASNAAGGIDITAHEDIDILLAASTGGEDILISTTGAHDIHITTTSTGTSADAIGLLTTGAGGGILLDTVSGKIALIADDSANGDIEIDSEDDTTITSGDDMTITVVGDFVLDITGAGTIKGQLLEDSRVTVVKSGAYTCVNPADIGKIILVDTAAVKITLPDISASLNGETYTIMNIGADGTEIFLDVTNGDKFLGGCGVAALDDNDKIKNTGATADRGDYVTVAYGSVDGWYITAMNGTWVDDND